MAIQYQNLEWAKDDLDLLDTLLQYKMDAKEFSNNEKVVELLCSAVDSVKNKESGHVLFSITSGKKSVLQLIDKNPEAYSYRKYGILTWKIDEKIEKGMIVKKHEEGNDSIIQWMDTTAQGIINGSVTDEMKNHIVLDGLNGYCLARRRFEEFCTFLAQDGKTNSFTRTDAEKMKAYKDGLELKSHLIDAVGKERSKITSMISGYVDRAVTEDIMFRKAIGFRSFVTETTAGKPFHIGMITKVIQFNGKRLYQIDVGQDIVTEGRVHTTTLVGRASAGITDKMNFTRYDDMWVAEVRPYYGDDFNIDKFQELPYNWVDEGRIVMAVPKGQFWNLLVGPDPRTVDNPVEAMKNSITKYIIDNVKKGIDISGTKIVDKDKVLVASEFEKATDIEGLSPIQRKCQAIKKMVEEYKYIIKKQKSVGKDVSVTDKIKFNHNEGKVSYNEFSISIDDELIRQEIFQCFETYLVKYYREEITEEYILNDVIDSIFNAVGKRINSYSKEPFVINLRINDAIDVVIEAKITKNSAKNIYLNGQRFNKNEVITVLKEMTCYRDQATADMFITNIGKMGLSVYIGCTTGYIVDNRMYKFKKLKGRSNYALLLDTIEIPIKGKTLMNLFYADFNGERIYDFKNKIPKTIYTSVENSLDYVKYKFLIDSAYEAFKDRSKQFLEKKVQDVNAEFVKYWNKKRRKEMDAILVKGTSGNTYAIAYDEKNSFVFINPTVKSEGLYEEGKYVCMIDQSNIKSNIGYDTVISKLMALSCDSVIASKIYNLEEELNG